MYTLEYRAFSNAGRSSGVWQQVELSVAAWNERAWVAAPVFSIRRPGQELLRNVKDGTLAYAGTSDSALALPSYLAGSDYIRPHISDRTVRDAQWLVLEALVDVDVYVVVHENVRGNFDAWELHERSSGILSERYMPGELEVYRRRVDSGSRVSVPGSDVYGQGGPVLTFVRYRSDNDVVILEPGASDAAVSGEQIVLRAHARVEHEQQLEWRLENLDGEVLSEAAGLRSWMQLPHSADRQDLRLKALLRREDGSIHTIRSQRLWLVNHGGVQFFNPGEESELLAGRRLPFDYELLLPDGSTGNSASVTWDASRDGESWHELDVHSGQQLQVPQETGRWLLRAGFEEGPGEKRYQVFSFMVVDVYSDVHIPLDFSAEPFSEQGFMSGNSGMKWVVGADRSIEVSSGTGEFRVVLVSDGTGNRLPLHPFVETDSGRVYARRRGTPEAAEAEAVELVLSARHGVLRFRLPESMNIGQIRIERTEGQEALR